MGYFIFGALVGALVRHYWTEILTLASLAKQKIKDSNNDD